MLRPDTAVQCSEFPAAVRCNINGHSIRLGFDVGLCDLLLSDWLPLEKVATLPDDLRKSVVTAALSPVTDFFTAHLSDILNVEDIEYQPTEPLSSSLAFNLSSLSGVIVGHVIADTDEQTVNTLHQLWQATAQPMPGINTENLPLRVEVIADSTTLSLETFRRLDKDDIILLDIEFPPLREVYARIGGNICFSSVIDGNKLIIQKHRGGTMESEEQLPIDREIEDRDVEDQEIDTPDTDKTLLADEAPPDELQPSEPPSTVADDKGDQNHRQDAPQLNDIDDLPVELLFIVDRFKTTLKEVKQIKPGYVFELNKKTTGSVEIHANGALVGSGELVQIEDRAGLRILELYHRSKTNE